MIKILYFSWVREKLARESEELSLTPTIVTIGDLLAHLAARGGVYELLAVNQAVGPSGARLGGRPGLRYALNHEFASTDSALHPGDEIAIFPPVTGG